jgi:hypothetical protein
MKAEADRCGLRVGRPTGRAAQPHMSCSTGHLGWVALWCPLEPSGIVAIADKVQFCLIFNPSC